MITRRQFLAASSCAALVGSLGSTRSFATGFKHPLGLQLFAVRAELAQDFAGTLARVASAGFSEIEFAGFHNKTASELKSIADLESRSDEVLEFATTLGVSHLVCSTPKSLSPDVNKLSWGARMHALTLDDWKANAEIFNRFGEKAKRFNIQLAYHNYCVEFKPQGNVVPYYELLRLTDKNFVKIQLDCGWAEVAGASSLTLLNQYQDRVVSLHLKDLKTKPGSEAPESIPNVPIGQGVLDWPRILRKAHNIGIKHYFLEQEPPYVEPIFDSLIASARYLSKVSF